MLVNLLLLKGNIGRDGAECRRCAAIPTSRASAPSAFPKSPNWSRSTNSTKQFGFEPPREEGHEHGRGLRRACSRARSRRSSASAAISSARSRNATTMEEAWVKMDLTVQIATKLNHSHLVNGRSPICCRAAAAPKRHAGQGPQRMEDTSLSMIRGSVGKAQAGERALPDSELAIVAGIAKATLPANPKVKWDEWVGRLRQGPRADRGDLSRRCSRTSTTGCSRPADFTRATRRVSGSGRPRAARPSSPCPTAFRRWACPTSRAAIG